MHPARWLAAVLSAAIAAAAAGPTTRPARDATPHQRLAQKYDRIALDRMDLEKVLAHYGQLSGLKIQPDWAALEEAGITRKTPVTLKAFGLTFEKMLDLTLYSIARRNRPLAWYLSGDTVHVSTQMRVLLRDRGPIAFSPAPAARPAAGRGGAAGEISFDQTALRDVIQFLRDLSGLNIHVNWRSLEVTGVTPDTPLTLKARGLSLRRLLDLITDHLSAGRDRFSSVYWILDEGVVHIATGDAFNQTTVTRSYEAGDLLMVIPNFPGPRISLNADTAQSGSRTTATDAPPTIFGPVGQQPQQTTNADDYAAQRQKLEEGLIEVIKNAIGEEMWRPTGRGSIRILRGQLIITQTPLGFKLLEKSLVR